MNDFIKTLCIIALVLIIFHLLVPLFAFSMFGLLFLKISGLL